MRITANYELHVCSATGKRYPNEGPCVEVSLWDERTEGNPMQSAIFQRQKEIAACNSGALQKYHEREFYGGDNYYFFPHDFWHQYPDIIKELEAAMNQAVAEVMAPIKVIELQQENEKLQQENEMLKGELVATRKAAYQRVWFPIRNRRQFDAARKKIEEVA